MKSPNRPPTFEKIGIRSESDPVLRKGTDELNLPKESALAQSSLGELKEILDQARRLYPFDKGVGIAAPQIGLPLRIALVRIPNGNQISLINPRLIETSEATDFQYEGCLSFFSVRGLVERPLSILVSNERLDGSRVEHRYSKGAARLILHEIDHLDGKLYIDRINMSTDLLSYGDYIRRRDRRWKYSGRAAS